MNMRVARYFEKTAQILCTDTDKTVEGAVHEFEEGVYLTVGINKAFTINLQYNDQHKLYIGKLSGMEFQTDGPKRIA